MFKRLCLFFSIGLLLCSSSFFAQTPNATLLGIVSDSTGGVINGAEVTLQDPKTGQTVRSAKSNESGSFQFDELKPGTYELRCVAPNYKMFVARDVVLDSGQVRRLDPQLVLGATVEEVTVNAGAAVINTESATISDLFTAKEHDQSPQVTIYPSTWYQLTTLAGIQGVTYPPVADGEQASQQTADQSARGTISPSTWYRLTTLAGIQGGTYPPVADGEQASQQTQTFDGIPNDLQGIQSNNANFYEQVSATLFNAPAESPVPFELNQVTKRGSNSFHGKATYRIFDSLFDATGYFNTTKSPYLQHEWDLEAAGPIWKNRTFFYGGWFGQRIPLGTLYEASVPSNDWRNGLFSTTIIDPETGLPFANNQIPANRISSVALAVQNDYFPASNIANGTTVNNYEYHFPFNSDLYAVTGRLYVSTTPCLKTILCSCAG